LTQPELETPPESGLGGWLLVFSIFLWALMGREALALLKIAEGFTQGVDALQLRPYSIVYGGRLAINGGFVGLLVVSIVLMHLRRVSFLRWGQIAMLCLILLPVLEYLWLTVAPWPGTMLGFLGTFAVWMLVHLVMGGAWLRYLRTSKRVAATFVRS